VITYVPPVLTIIIQRFAYRAFIGFIWLPEQTHIIAVTNINKLIFLMVMACVFFQAGTEYLKVTEKSFDFKWLNYFIASL
jgi:hypothetical protein